MVTLKKPEFILLDIKSPYANLSRNGINAVVRKQYELLPHYRPARWDRVEPIKHHFDIANIEQIWPEGVLDTVFWKKTGKNRAEGSWWERVESLNGHHANLKVYVYDTKHQQELLDTIKELGVYMETDYAFLDAYTHQYKPVLLRNSGNIYGSLTVTTHILRHWLPDMTWATVFGPAYIRLFGKDNLLSAPACHVEDLGPEHVFIQLTASLDDLFEKFDEVMEAREAVKQHLGYDCFFQAGKAYNWMQEPEQAGKVFRTPEFYMHDDYVRPKTFIENPETGELFELIPGEPLPSWFFDESSRPAVSYDNASWHYGSEFFPEFLPPEQGAVHIGMFVAWCINNGWLAKKSSKAIEAVKARKMTGTEFVMKQQGEKFFSSVLQDEIQPFVSDYYNTGSTEFARTQGSYFDDLEKLLDDMEQITGKMPVEILQKTGDAYKLTACYLVRDSWENYELIEAVISQRYSEWQAFPDKSK